MTVTLPAAQTRIGRDQVLGLCVLACFLACYAGVCASLVQQWLTNDMYAHGFLIPLISGYLLYERRASLARVAIAPDLVGGTLLLGGGLTLLLLGQIGGVISIAQLSLLVSASGVVLLLFGRGMLKQVRIALAYLLFMIPIWDFATGAFQGSFQLLSADIGATLLRVAGIPVRHDGVYLELPNVTLQVAEACSGVNFVVAILAVSIPQAYLRLTANSLRVFVALFAVVVALLTNGLRVALIGVLSYSGLSGPEIHGPGHVLQGMSVAVIGFLAMFATVHLLARRSGARREPSPPAAAVQTAPAFPRDGRVAPRLAFATCLVLAGTAGLQAVSLTNPVELLAPVSTFPANLGAWRSGPAISAPKVVSGAGADSAVSRSYVSGAGRVVYLYAGYFRYQVQAKELVSDRMSALHQTSQPVLVTPPDGVAFRANETTQTVGRGRQYILFWYDINGRPVVNRYAAKAWTIWDSISRRRSNGALVMLIADLPDNADSTDVIRGTRELGGLTAVALRTYLPR